MQKLDQRFEALLRTIEIRQRGNLFFATSEEEPTLFVSAYSEDELDAMLRHRLGEIFREIHQLPVSRVLTEAKPDRKHLDAYIFLGAAA